MAKAIFVLFTLFCLVQIFIIPSLGRKQQEVDGGLEGEISKQMMMNNEIGEKIYPQHGCLMGACSPTCWCCVDENKCYNDQQTCEQNCQ